MPANTIAAIDFGTSKIALAQIHIEEQGNYKVIGSAAVNYAGFHDGTFVDFNELDDAIVRVRHECSRQSGKLVKNMLVGVPGEFLNIEIHTVEMRVGGLVSARDYDRLLALVPDGPSDSSIVLHRQVLAFKMEGHLRETFPEGEYAAELGAVISVIYSRREFHDIMEDALGGLGIGIAGYVASPVALAAALIQRENITSDVLLIDVGHLSCDVIAARKGGIVYHVNLDTGGADITADIARALNVDFYEAELLKRRQGTDMLVRPVNIGNQMYALQDVIDARVRAIVRNVQNTLLSASVDWNAMESIWLLGSGVAPLRGGREIFSAAFDRNVRAQPGLSPLFSGNACNTAMSILIYYMQYTQTLRQESWFARLKRRLGSE